jgi:hypothetical protein
MQSYLPWSSHQLNTLAWKFKNLTLPELVAINRSNVCPIDSAPKNSAGLSLQWDRCNDTDTITQATDNRSRFLTDVALEKLAEQG